MAARTLPRPLPTGSTRTPTPTAPRHPVPGPARPQAQATIPASRLQCFLRGARDHGVDTTALLAQHGIADPVSGVVLSRVPIARFASLLQSLGRRMGDEFLGCCSRPVRPGTLALAATTMRRSATLEQALRTGLGIYRLAIDDFSARLQVGDGVARLVLMDHHGMPQGRFVHCAFLHFFWGLCCWLVQERIPIDDATLGYAAPAAPDRDARHLFGIALRWGHGHSSITFDARWLSRAIVADEGQLQALLQHLPEALLLRFRDQNSLDTLVRQCLLRQLASGLPSLEQTAWNLKMTPHALRRGLARQGTSFQDIKNALRRDAAIALLTQSGLGLDEIAQRLAFSEPSTFHRSFKRWTGVAPGAFRRAHAAAGQVRPP